MELDRFLDKMGINKEGIMQKEIIVRKIGRKDTGSGPMISIMDGESVWYSVFKSSVKDDTWDQLCAIKDGDRADISWTTTVSKRDGKSYNNLTGFTKVIREEQAPPTPPDDVAPQHPSGPGRDVIISKQVCLKGGVELVVAIINGYVDRMPGVDGIAEIRQDPAGQAMIYAKRLFSLLMEEWQ